MRDLNFELKNMCRNIKHGSYVSRANRHSILQISANQLFDLGYKLDFAKSLKPKHVESLLGKWKEEGLSTGTIKNRLSHLRWWAKTVGKPGILKKENAKYGIGARKKNYTPRAFSLSTEMLDQITNDRVRLALQLQQTFGLRKEEALKFRPSVAVFGEKLVLHPAWTKGRRGREIPITNEYQRKLLDAVHTMAGNGSLVPTDKNYIQFVRVYYREACKAKIKNPHGLRHFYAQQRYMTLTCGMKPPALGGVKPGSITNSFLPQN
ncbi:MAG: integrase domain-containing protein [Methylocystaceae bacterium]|nr:integrase domain-containing protein [Methylocystaceae bacterium]